MTENNSPRKRRLQLLFLFAGLRDSVKNFNLGTARGIVNRFLIQAHVCVEVGRQVGEAVRFFTAVRSAMDVFHGTDGFFEFRGMVVTIDVTMNPHKDSGKADVIVHADDLENLTALAGRIARKFTTKQRRSW